MKGKRERPGAYGGILATLITLVCWSPIFISDIYPLYYLMFNIGYIPTMIIFFPVLYLSFAAAIIIHESGHLIFGLLGGYSFSSFRIFSMMIVKTEKGIKIKRLSILGTAGQCLLTPPETKNGKMPTMLYNIGGSLLGLIAALLFGLLAYTARAGVISYMLFVTVAVANLSVALTNGIPLTTPMINNDGKNALILMKNPRATGALRIQLLVNAQRCSGVRLVEMPDEWFEMPTDGDLKDSLTVGQAMLCFLRAFDKGEYENAKKIALKIFDSKYLLGAQRMSLIINLAFVHIMLGEYSAARRLLKKEYLEYSAIYLKDLSAARTRYAYELLAKDSLKGAKRERLLVNMIFRKLQKYPFREEIEEELERIRMVDSIYDEKTESQVNALKLIDTGAKNN